MANPKKPTNLKIIQGTFRKDRATPNEPKPNINIPSPPDHLSKEALIEWGRITPILYNLGLLSDLDMVALAAYCQAYGRWTQAEMELKSSGIIIKTQNGNVIQNPLVGIANQAMLQTHKFLVEFGLSPASRSKVSANKQDDKKADPWGAFG